eukprot:339969-Prorocentrum_minimum.AAC.3
MRTFGWGPVGVVGGWENFPDILSRYQSITPLVRLYLYRCCAVHPALSNGNAQTSTVVTPSLPHSARTTHAKATIASIEFHAYESQTVARIVVLPSCGLPGIENQVKRCEPLDEDELKGLCNYVSGQPALR